jgi:hypothetical protein
VPVGGLLPATTRSARAYNLEIADIHTYYVRHLTGHEFETVFLSVFRGEGDRFEAGVAQAVRTLFDAVESYCDDVDLREPGDLDEDGLLRAAIEFCKSAVVAGPGLSFMLVAARQPRIQRE